MQLHVVEAGAGEVAELGVASMRLLVSSADTGGAFSLGEFRGDSGPWTVPHVHREAEEAFYVLEGSFSFTLGGRRVEAEPGAFLVVPRGTPHVLSAGPAGGAALVLWSPGGLEQMFLELARLGPTALTDPRARARLSERFDSVPVASR